MADVKISALAVAGSVALADYIPCVIAADVPNSPKRATFTVIRAALFPAAIASDVSGLAAGVATFLGTPSGANLATALTSALPATKGGTGLTSLGANVATFLGTPTTANLAAAVTGETGTGALVFGTDPTITTTRINDATSGGTINNCTLGATAGTLRRVYFTDAIGPTITGFDATSVADGTILRVTAVGGTVAFNHENAGSTAANRITCGGLTINLPAGSHVDFEYDLTNTRWRANAGTAI